MNDTEKTDALLAEQSSAQRQSAVAQNKNGTASHQPVPAARVLAPETKGAPVAAPAKTAVVPPRAGGLISRIFGRDKNPLCTCGREPGKQGRHAKDCPVSKKSAEAGSGHFGAVDMSQHHVLPQGTLPLVPAVATPPVDFSFWGRVAKTVLRSRIGLKARGIFKKCLPIIGDEKAREFSDEIRNALTEKEIEQFAESAVACAQYYNINPKHAPAADLVLQAVNIELSLSAASSRVEAGLRRIEEQMKKANELKEAA
jgi:hypothetical protein